MKLAADGFVRLNLDDRQANSNNNKPFVEPIPICFPIVDLINGTRRIKDSNGELVAMATSYQVVATRDIQEGEELLLCYGEDQLNNLDFFVKFGYIPLKQDGCPVLVPDDFVTLPLGPQLRPQVVGDQKIRGISKLDQLRWSELDKYDMGQSRLVEPVAYFQRPLYINGNLEAARRLRNSSAFSGPGVSISQIDKMEQYVMTMLANKQALKKLSEGKMPPPPMLDGWEPGQRMVQILDYYLVEHTTLSQTTTEEDLEASKSQTGNRQLATQARMVERELLLIWRHAIACHHGLYRAEKAGVDRLPKSNKSCCVQCRTSLSIFPCPKCGSVYYCSDACQQYDWDQGQHSRLCALFAAKNKT
ncbi:MYND finger domain containing protein [Nitzschia inconspicua]|uniref:MYND finger domain containing protein n=1 Tax=Nitzschia inconspicua TaxID=303405 RepID=A0A9K3LQA9_9STRA|nr:MYND finger domain containing protein [Nitzschia inconspicua]